MKLKLALLTLLAGSLLTSCYKADSLPNQFVSTYEFAIPVIDTMLHVKDFPFFENVSIPFDDITIPAGTTISTNIMHFPFYLGDFTKQGDSIVWIEPKMILRDSLPAGTTITLNMFTEENNMPYYFWLPPNYQVVASGNPVTIPQTPIRISAADLDRIKDEPYVYLVVSLTFANAVNGGELKNSSLHPKFGIKARVDMTIDL